MCRFLIILALVKTSSQMYKMPRKRAKNMGEKTVIFASVYILRFLGYCS